MPLSVWPRWLYWWRPGFCWSVTAGVCLYNLHFILLQLYFSSLPVKHLSVRFRWLVLRTRICLDFNPNPQSTIKKILSDNIEYEKYLFMPYFFPLPNSITCSLLQTVMWIRIDCMRIRIHKNWWMRIRIQAGSRSIYHQIDFKQSFKDEKKKYFQCVPKS